MNQITYGPNLIMCADTVKQMKKTSFSGVWHTATDFVNLWIQKIFLNIS
jgi:hypothetical protein